jgi:Ca2+-transporting ATPase
VPASLMTSKPGLLFRPSICSSSSLNDLSSDDLRILVAETGVFGRATPADKLRLLGSLQEQGHVVLATGDGTNDAPILATADVGESFSI